MGSSSIVMTVSTSDKKFIAKLNFRRVLYHFIYSRNLRLKLVDLDFTKEMSLNSNAPAVSHIEMRPHLQREMWI
jgi:hypothetical protein